MLNEHYAVAELIPQKTNHFVENDVKYLFQVEEEDGSIHSLQRSKRVGKITLKMTVMVVWR